MLLVLILLAHDGLMASVAHAAPMVQPVLAAHKHSPAHKQTANMAFATATASENDHPPEHPSACGVAGTAVPASGQQLELADLGDAGRITDDLRDTAQPWIDCGDDPCWPPGRRRALLQVYRI